MMQLKMNYEEITRRVDEDGDETEQMQCRCYDADIMRDGEKIGYVQIFESYDEDGDLTSAYLASIDIDEAQRCKGYGAEIIQQLADQYDGIYLCPENERCEHLYQRMGEELEGAPEELEGCYDEYGKMYYIPRS